MFEKIILFLYSRSEIEGQSMHIDSIRDVSYFSPVNGYLISQHTRSRHFDRIWPVVVIITQSIGEIQDRFFWNLWSILHHVKVGWFDLTLSCLVRNQEEVKLAIFFLWLLYKSRINICSLRRVWYLRFNTNLEKSLSDSFVHKNESNIRFFNFALSCIVNPFDKLL